jgi:hypothetical protein
MLGKFFDKFCFTTIVLIGAVLVLAGMQLSSVFKADEGGKMTGPTPILPKTIGLWIRPDSPKVVTSANIFDYMDGAGELYLGYRFDHLDVYEYKARSQKEILVELYFMKSSDDAFGLLSLDWGGETIDLIPTSHHTDMNPDAISWPRALYGQGLLRIWSGDIYARVMATQETPESREAVLSIGKAIAEDRKDQPDPKIIGELRNPILMNWALRWDRTSFFRTHLVLNSLFYISHRNILDLDLACEAVAAVYEKKKSPGDRTRIQFLLVKYPSAYRAKEALYHFHSAYLPEHALAKESSTGEIIQNAYAMEDGWMAYTYAEKSITFVFECPDQETVRAIMDQIK